jgi:hypothetical protein
MTEPDLPKHEFGSHHDKPKVDPIAVLLEPRAAGLWAPFVDESDDLIHLALIDTHNVIFPEKKFKLVPLGFC